MLYIIYDSDLYGRPGKQLQIDIFYKMKYIGNNLGEKKIFKLRLNFYIKKNET